MIQSLFFAPRDLASPEVAGVYVDSHGLVRRSDPLQLAWHNVTTTTLLPAQVTSYSRTHGNTWKHDKCLFLKKKKKKWGKTS